MQISRVEIYEYLLNQSLKVDEESEIESVPYECFERLDKACPCCGAIWVLKGSTMESIKSEFEAVFIDRFKDYKTDYGKYEVTEDIEVVSIDDFFLEITTTLTDFEKVKELVFQDIWEVINDERIASLM